MKQPGDINANDQQVLRITTEQGNGPHSRIWILKCRRCRNIYGSNGHDAFERRCPKCDGGATGLTIPAERTGEDWTREEHIIAFQLYSRIPFGKMHMRNPAVIELAALLGRKIGSAAMKLSNFARLDPALNNRGIRGLSRGARGEGEIWREFEDQPETLAFESAQILARRLGQSLDEVAGVAVSDLPPQGLERDALVKIRVNQSFFRNRVLSAYDARCCVTGLTQENLLVAGHIIPWAEDPANRLNPRNGICLNPLHDRVFERGLMWIETGFVIRMSSQLRKETPASKDTVRWLLSFDGKPLLLPKKFSPDSDLLARHASRSIASKSSLGTG